MPLNYIKTNLLTEWYIAYPYYHQAYTGQDNHTTNVHAGTRTWDSLIKYMSVTVKKGLLLLVNHTNKPYTCVTMTLSIDETLFALLNMCLFG